MDFFALSDAGVVRKNNEDSYAVKKYNDTELFAVVADGMGGHLGGKVASELAVETIMKSMEVFFWTKQICSSAKNKANYD